MLRSSVVFKLPPLPYAYEALAPTISAVTMRLHHDKHHAKYVETTNSLLEKSGAAPASLEEAIATARGAGQAKLFNNAAQAWNHAFFWSCMAPGGSRPSEAVVESIGASFGGLDQMRDEF